MAAAPLKFIRNKAKEEAYVSNPKYQSEADQLNMTLAQYLEERGGINAEGIYGDSFVEGYTGQPVDVQKKYILDNNLILNVRYNPQTGMYDLGARSAKGDMVSVDANAARQAIRASYATDAISMQKRLIELTNKANSGAPLDPSDAMTKNRQSIGALSLNEIEEYNYLKSNINEKIKFGPTVYGTNPGGPGTPTVDTYINPETGIDSRTGRKSVTTSYSSGGGNNTGLRETFGPDADKFYEQLKGKATSGTPLTKEEKDFTSSYLTERGKYLGGQRVQGKQLTAEQLAEESFLSNLGYLGGTKAGAPRQTGLRGDAPLQIDGDGQDNVGNEDNAAVDTAAANAAAAADTAANTTSSLDAATKALIKSLQDQIAKLTKDVTANTTAANAAATATTYNERMSVYSSMADRFSKYGMTSLANKIKELATSGATEATIMLELQETPEYKERFSANEQRRLKGLKVLSPSEYIAVEDGYRQVLRAYGLKQFDNDAYIKKFIENDTAPTEFSKRVVTAVQRVQNADPALIKQLNQFYGMTPETIVAYVLDPEQEFPKIERQIAAGEIGVAAGRQGLQVGVSVADQLAAQGITEAEAQKGYATIADYLPTAEKLSDIYGATMDTFGQSEAEQLQFNSLASAQRKRQKLTAREIAAFSGSSGTNRTSLTTSAVGQY